MTFKTVKERILDCNLEKLLNELFCYFRDSQEKKPTEKHRNNFQAIVDDIKETTPLNNEGIIHAKIVDPYGEEKGNESRPSVNDKGFDLRTLDVYVSVSDAPSDYSFICCEWEESLGYKVGDELVMEYGLETIMAAILYEMTWFGVSAEETHNFIVETAQDLDEVKERENENSST